ncbi:MAG: hypothetical protein H0T46_21700 [Deltaproteobacteria bacterium]|nr:hypothetical protein [Deltaproteobacteria bacterium]
MVRIPSVEFQGHAAIELVDAGTRMVLVHDVGPRIAAFGRADSESLLFWDSAGLHSRNDWKLYGGHRLWVTRPDADESEETYAPHNAEKTEAEHIVKVRGWLMAAGKQLAKPGD